MYFRRQVIKLKDRLGTPTLFLVRRHPHSDEVFFQIVFNVVLQIGLVFLKVEWDLWSPLSRQLHCNVPSHQSYNLNLTHATH